MQAGQGRVKDRGNERLGRSRRGHHPVAKNSCAGIARHRRVPPGQAVDDSAGGRRVDAQVLKATVWDIEPALLLIRRSGEG